MIRHNTPICRVWDSIQGIATLLKPLSRRKPVEASLFVARGSRPKVALVPKEMVRCLFPYRDPFLFAISPLYLTLRTQNQAFLGKIILTQVAISQPQTGEEALYELANPLTLGGFCTYRVPDHAHARLCWRDVAFMFLIVLPRRAGHPGFQITPRPDKSMRQELWSDRAHKNRKEGVSAATASVDAPASGRGQGRSRGGAARGSSHRHGKDRVEGEGQADTSSSDSRARGRNRDGRSDNRSRGELDETADEGNNSHGRSRSCLLRRSCALPRFLTFAQIPVFPAQCMSVPPLPAADERGGHVLTTILFTVAPGTRMTTRTAAWTRARARARARTRAS